MGTRRRSGRAEVTLKVTSGGSMYSPCMRAATAKCSEDERRSDLALARTCPRLEQREGATRAMSQAVQASECSRLAMKPSMTYQISAQAAVGGVLERIPDARASPAARHSRARLACPWQSSRAASSSRSRPVRERFGFPTRPTGLGVLVRLRRTRKGLPQPSGATHQGLLFAQGCG